MRFGRRRRRRSHSDDDFVPTSEGATFRPPFISPRDTGRWAIGLLLLTMALAWISIGIDLSNLRQIFQATHGTAVPRDLRTAQFTTESWLVSAQLLAVFATGVAFMAWLYQLRVNLRALGVRRPVYRREWCIWGFLFPGVNFFRPYQVMREIWQASDPDNLDAFLWRQQPVPQLLGIWWLSFLLSVNLRLLAWLSDIGAGVNLQRIQVSMSLLTLADVAAGISAGLACFVVTRLSESQEAKWEAQSQRDATGHP
ncbi:MAG: DUF4328 domain-containing protein [Deltaproteobacteria bacterium]|nr:DUF4328 domain-containing protein [Deltaproteobacteria bacterium]MBW2361618.1 DUF4328 domain-containing protein [Deltaproteobacteria bacterium]